jgi:hypothetical protein
VSAVIALARPRRIKASHRRRRKVAAGHLLYILNNPLSGTDPSGYAVHLAGRKDGCNGMQSCELQQNPLSQLQAGINQARGDSAAASKESSRRLSLRQLNSGTAPRNVTVTVGDVEVIGANGATGTNSNQTQPDHLSGNVPSYGRRVMTTGYGIAVGLFGSIAGMVGAQPSFDPYENFGSGLYEDTTLATDFQGGHNFGYVLGFFGAIAGAKPGSGATANSRPIMNFADDFTANTYRNGTRNYQINDPSPDGFGHGLMANVTADGQMTFTVRANSDLRAQYGSGGDMFDSLMLRLRSDNVTVNSIRGEWHTGTDSVNATQFMAARSAGLSAENAAFSTWTGMMAKRHGFTNVVVPESTAGVIRPVFSKPLER